MTAVKEKPYMYVLEDKRGRRHKLFELDKKLSIWNLVPDKSIEPKLDEVNGSIRVISLDALTLMVGSTVVDKKVKAIKKFRGRILVQLVNG